MARQTGLEGTLVCMYCKNHLNSTRIKSLNFEMAELFQFRFSDGQIKRGYFKLIKMSNVLAMIDKILMFPHYCGGMSSFIL